MRAWLCLASSPLCTAAPFFFFQPARARAPRWSAPSPRASLGLRWSAPRSTRRHATLDRAVSATPPCTSASPPPYAPARPPCSPWLRVGLLLLGTPGSSTLPPPAPLHQSSTPLWYDRSTAAPAGPRSQSPRLALPVPVFTCSCAVASTTRRAAQPAGAGHPMSEHARASSPSLDRQPRNAGPRLPWMRPSPPCRARSVSQRSRSPTSPRCPTAAEAAGISPHRLASPPPPRATLCRWSDFGPAVSVPALLCSLRVASVFWKEGEEGATDVSAPARCHCRSLCAKTRPGQVTATGVTSVSLQLLSLCASAILFLLVSALEPWSTAAAVTQSIVSLFPSCMHSRLCLASSPLCTAVPFFFFQPTRARAPRWSAPSPRMSLGLRWSAPRSTRRHATLDRAVSATPPRTSASPPPYAPARPPCPPWLRVGLLLLGTPGSSTLPPPAPLHQSSTPLWYGRSTAAPAGPRSQSLRLAPPVPVFTCSCAVASTTRRAAQPAGAGRPVSERAHASSPSLDRQPRNAGPRPPWMRPSPPCRARSVSRRSRCPTAAEAAGISPHRLASPPPPGATLCRWSDFGPAASVPALLCSLRFASGFWKEGEEGVLIQAKTLYGVFTAIIPGTLNSTLDLGLISEKRRGHFAYLPCMWA
ncbi:uncharacterized protein [Miscanthus floridulus]|uniref:uncharacterized protein n=1 Tax=Miscanthus floridulus TaxID=154761 RepID=UPI003459285B